MKVVLNLIFMRHGGIFTRYYTNAFIYAVATSAPLTLKKKILLIRKRIVMILSQIISKEIAGF